MTGYLIRRLLSMVPVLGVVAAVTFALIRILPGDPAAAMLGEQATHEDIESLRREMGLNAPIPLQFLEWAGKAVQGDLGRSLKTRQKITEAIVQRLPVTVELTVLAMVFAVLVGVPCGVVSAVRPNSRVDVAASVISIVGVAIPGFFLGILLILLFGLVLRWLPPSGYVPLGRGVLSNLEHMILPSVTLGLGIAAVIMRQIRSSLLEVLQREYVLTARSKGLPEWAIIGRHALGNALIPAVTIVGLQVGRLFGGAVITESVFAIPGIGRLVIEGIMSRDFEVVQGVVLFMALAVLFSSLVVDMVYSYLDPRIRYR